jgi:PAS domain S-box-containing protein
MRLRMLVIDDAAEDVEALLRELGRAGFAPTLRRIGGRDEYVAVLGEEYDALAGELRAPHAPLGVSVLTVADAARALASVGRAEPPSLSAADPIERLHDALAQGLEQRSLREMNRRAADALLESEQRYRTLAENSAVGIWHLTHDGRTLYANPAMCAMLEVDRTDDLAERPYTSFFSAESLARMDAEPTNAPAEAEIVGLRGGRRDVVCWGASLCNSNGERTSSIRTFTDVTELRELQGQFHQAQKMEAIGRLAGGVAHDFNNLLTVVLTCCGLLQRRLPDGDPGRKQVDHIESAVKRGSALTRQILAFARQQILEPMVLDMNDVVSRIETLLRHLIGEDIELHAQLARSPWRIKADRGQIEQILMNLAVNARDAMPRGGKLTITTSNVELDDLRAHHVGVTPGRYALLTVSDTGCGMDAATRARIFEPFFTTKEVGKGTGLGLATVFGIVRQSRGAVQVDSAPGRGASFRVYLPAVEHEAALQAPSEAAPAVAAGHQTVLLVDDEDSIRGPLAEFLRMHGFTILEARNGKEAIACSDAFAGPIDILVTDVVMPKMGGKSLAEHLSPRRPGIRVLYLSGYAENTIVRRGHLDAGAALLQKPFAPEALVSRIHELLAGSRPPPA